MMNKRQRLILVLVTAVALLLTACGGWDSSESGTNNGGTAPTAAAISQGDPGAGETKYEQVCITCHGPGGEGVTGLGKPFTTSEFVTTTDDEVLLAFVKTGRPISDPANTTGVDMPPKGGNPALTDEDILNIIAYIRTLHE
ncbi:MAG: c-type cytochrome [Ardenticatenaceae bacterium]|nr:c-type cytochrome [Ardenticatenaceae bacterium]